MKLKKIISVIICIVMCMSVCAVAFSVGAKEQNPKHLNFNDDGTFKILMVNDTQDTEKMVDKTKKFLEKSIEQEKPDLIVLAGDILSDIWPFCTEEKLFKNIRNICGLFESYKVPFAITMGNHDHDRCDECSSVEAIMNVATGYSYHVSTADGCDPATYSIPIYSSDDSKVQYVVYVMDSNNKGQALSMSGYTGCTADQINWYNNKSAQYKAANGGEPVKATVIQHVAVAEIYDFLREIPMSEYLDEDAVFSSNDYKWYKLKDGVEGTLGEAPCSELTSTGEYDAWVNNGDVVSAFFAHDHVNSFSAYTEDGIYMGYNGGTGFNSYGLGDNRSCRVINVDEKNTAQSDSHLILYRDIVGEKIPFYISDLISPRIINVLMKVVYLIPGLFAKIFG